MQAAVLFSIERRYASQITNNIGQLMIRRHDYFRIMLQSVLCGFQSFQQLGIPDEILVSRFIDEPNRFRLSLGLQDARFPDSFCLLDRRTFYTVRRCLRGDGKVDLIFISGTTIVEVGGGISWPRLQSGWSGSSPNPSARSARAAFLPNRRAPLPF